MAFELDPCLVRTTSGELLARGFVREASAATLLVEAEHFSGGWLAEGDPAVVEVMSAHRGACTYDAVVGFSAAHRIELVDLRLRQAVQQRQAVRVPITLPLRVTHLIEDGEQVPLDEPVDVVIIDVSAHGLRFRCDAAFEPGTRVALTLTATRFPLELEVEVLRQEEVRAEIAHGCRIVALTEREMDELFRYVLEEQRRQLAVRADTR